MTNNLIRGLKYGVPILGELIQLIVGFSGCVGQGTSSCRVLPWSTALSSWCLAFWDSRLSMNKDMVQSRVKSWPNAMKIALLGQIQKRLQHGCKHLQTYLLENVALHPGICFFYCLDPNDALRYLRPSWTQHALWETVPLVCSIV